MSGKRLGRAAAAFGLWTLALAAQDAPQLLSPAPGASPGPRTLFTWTEVPDAQTYRLQVARDKEFGPPLLVNLEQAGRAFQASLPPADSYWWRVCAVYADRTSGPWSEAREFRPAAPALARSVLGVSLIPGAVIGGSRAQALITLDAPAPAGGVSVVVSSSNAAVARVPGRVTLARGETAASVEIQTTEVYADTEVRITASARDNAQSVTLAVAAPAKPATSPLVSFDVSPAAPAAGNDIIGTVTLAALAPTPTPVRISVSDPSALTAPQSITVRRGRRAENFLVKTARDTANRSVTLTATLDGVTRSAEVSLRAAGSSAPLEAPEPLAPAPNDSVDGALPANFAWGEVFGAASYTVQVSAASDFVGLLLASRTLPATSAAIGPLPSGPAWWRVCANDSSGALGRWSPIRPLSVK